MALQMYFLHNEYSINYSYVFLKLQINFVKVQILGFRSYFNQSGTSLVVQWLRLCPPNTGDVVSTPGQGTTFHKPQLKILHTATKTQRSQTVIFFFNKQTWIARFATFKAKSQTYIIIYKIDSQWEFAVWFRELKPDAL